MHIISKNYRGSCLQVKQTTASVLFTERTDIVVKMHLEEGIQKFMQILRRRNRHECFSNIKIWFVLFLGFVRKNFSHRKLEPLREYL